MISFYWFRNYGQVSGYRIIDTLSAADLDDFRCHENLVDSALEAYCLMVVS